MVTKKLPRFPLDLKEREFWDKHDSIDYIDWRESRIGVFPNLKPSTKTTSLRLPSSLLEALKVIANKKDVPYQSLMKVFLSDRLKDEMVKPTNDRPNRRSIRGD